MVSLGVGGDAADYFSTETLEIAVVLMIANVVMPAEAHYLIETSSFHCGLGGTFDNSWVAVFTKKKINTKWIVGA